MIRILATAILALCLNASGAFATSLVEFVETGGIFYKKFTDVPFTGKVDEGAWRGAFKNGKFEGPWFWYQDHGQLPNKGEYKNGKFKGRWVVSREDGSKAEVSSGIDRNGKKVSD